MKKYDLRFFSIIVSLLFVLYLAFIFKDKLDNFNNKYFHLTQKLYTLQNNWDNHLSLIKDSIITLYHNNDAISNHLKDDTTFMNELLSDKFIKHYYPLLYKSLKIYEEEVQNITTDTYDFLQVNNVVKNSLLILNNKLSSLQNTDHEYYTKLAQNIIYYTNIKNDFYHTSTNNYLEDKEYFKNDPLIYIHLKQLDTFIPKLHTIYFDIKSSQIPSLIDTNFSLLDKESIIQKNKMKTLFYIIIFTTIIFFLIIVFLVQDVKRQATQLIEKDKLLLNQAKHAAMGEMIDAIAHQWKQPLTIIQLNTDYLFYELKNDILTKKQVINFQEKIFSQLEHLHDTLNQFRSFLRPNKETKEFSVQGSIKEVLTLTKDTLLKNKITVNLSTTDDIIINGVPNEFKHVLINLINNSKDAFIENNIQKRTIKITLEQKQKTKYIYIEDNAGGIPEHIIERVFEPNITSKKEGSGTGIGLYMTKQILDKLGATIEVKNINQGCCFIIEIQANNNLL